MKAFALCSILGVGVFMFLKSETINHEFDDLFKYYAKKHNLDWKLLKRISFIESRIGLYKTVKHGIKFPHDVLISVSGDGLSWGLMQTTLSTSRDYDITATAEKLNNPSFSISIAAQHISFLKRKYFSNERDIVMAYNHGQGNQLRFIALEKSGQLKENEFPAGRDYWSKYQSAARLIP